jgi:hypothetical protein
MFAANAQYPDRLHKYDLDMHITGSIKQIVERSYSVDKGGNRKYVPYGVRIQTFNESGYVTSESYRDTEEELEPERGYWQVSNFLYHYDKEDNLVQEDEVYTAEAYSTRYRNRKVGQTYYRIGKNDGYYTKTVHTYASSGKSQLQEFIYYSKDTTKYQDRIVFKWKGNKMYESLHYKENGKLDYKIEYERDQWGKELERKVIDVATNNVTFTTSTRYEFNDGWSNWTKMYKTFKEPGKPDETVLYERHLEYYKELDKPGKERLFNFLSAKLIAGTGMDYWVPQESDSFQVTRIAAFTSGDELTFDYFVTIDDDVTWAYVYRFNPKNIIGMREVPTALTDKKIIQIDLAKETNFEVKKITPKSTQYQPGVSKKSLHIFVAPQVDVSAFIKALEELNKYW